MDNDSVDEPVNTPSDSDRLPIGGALYVVIFLLMVYMPLILLIDTAFFFIRPPELFTLAQMLGIKEIVERLTFYKLILCYAGWFLYWATGILLLCRFRLPTIKIATILMVISYLVNSGAVVFFSRHAVPRLFDHHLSDIIFNAYNQNAVLSIALVIYLYCSKRARKTYGTEAGSGKSLLPRFAD